jgi:pyruvate/2-oxoacid:ferredoxin oxidoreductase alpha subunit
MCNLTMLAFELADRYRNPVALVADGFIGQMMEPVDVPDPVTKFPDKPWAVKATAETRDNLISSIHLDHNELEAHIDHLYEKYAAVEKHEVRYEGYRLDDAEYVTVAYGIVSRVLMTAIDLARAEGIKVGMLRPITLWPFPVYALDQAARKAKGMLVAECSKGMMVDDVKLAIECRIPVQLHSRNGGNIPSAQELYEAIVKLTKTVG